VARGRNNKEKKLEDRIQKTEVLEVGWSLNVSSALRLQISHRNERI
jgi:hypothetical protein